MYRNISINIEDTEMEKAPEYVLIQKLGPFLGRFWIEGLTN